MNDCYAETIAAYERYPNNFVILDGNAKNNWKECMYNKMQTLPYVAGKPRNFCNFQLNTAPVFVGDHFFPSKLYEHNGDAEKALDACIIECKNVKNKNECQLNCTVDFNALEKVEFSKIEIEHYNNESCNDNLADEEKIDCGTNMENKCHSLKCCYDPNSRKLKNGHNVPWCYKSDNNHPKSLSTTQEPTQEPISYQNISSEKTPPKSLSSVSPTQQPTQQPTQRPTTYADIAKEKPITFYTIFIITAVSLSFILFICIIVLLSKNIPTKTQ